MYFALNLIQDIWSKLWRSNQSRTKFRLISSSNQISFNFFDLKQKITIFLSWGSIPSLPKKCPPLDEGGGVRVGFISFINRLTKKLTKFAINHVIEWR